MKIARAGALVATSVLACLTGLTVRAGAATSDANAYTTQERYISSADGTQLQIRLYRPAKPKGRTPVILQASPYAGSGGSFYVPPPVPTGQGVPGPGSFARTERIFERGYSFMTVELRGYGGSGGCYDWGGDGERSDVKSAVEWAARQPWSTGKVGMIGHSYDGWTGLMAIRAKAKGLAAVITESPPSGYRNSYTNGVRTFGGGTAFAGFYAASDLWTPSVFAPAREWQEALSGSAADPSCYPTTVAGSYSSDPNDPYWLERDAIDSIAGTKVPVFLVQGFNDFNVRADNVLPKWRTFNGPRQAVLGPWWHGYSQVGTAFWDLEMRFFDRWLKRIAVTDDPRVLVQDASGTWRAEPDWPPPDARTWTMKLRPGDYLDAPGNNGETWLPDAFPAPELDALPTGNGIWTFTQKLPYAVRSAGVATVRANLSLAVPNANLIGLVYDIDPSGNAIFVQRGAYRATRSGRVAFALYPHDWNFAAGHRIGVLLTGADDIWFEPSGTTSQVTVSDATIGLPVLRAARVVTRAGPLEARTPYPPFSVASELEGSTLEQPLPPRMR